nr:hypothetical protein [Tanacetum cinerariifolium]
MVDVNVNAPEQAPAMAPSTHTDDQILPRSRWRALTTIINLCLTGKTSGFERPRAPVLQILWGVVNRAHIDYAERMWEEFTQFIHSFIEDKKNLALHTQGKKKANPLVILIVSLVLREPNGKSLGCRFRMNLSLMTFEVDNTNEYLEKVAKHQRYLAGEEGSDPDSPAPKPAKATKPKATKQSMPSVPKAAPVTKPASAKASKSTSSQQPKPAPSAPKPAPAKPQEKKQRLPTSSLRLVDEFVDEGVPENEPRFDDEEANLQRAVKEILKDVHATHQGPLPPVVLREPDSQRRQSLPEVQGKGKEKVIEEQVVHSLLDLNTPKKKSTTDQYTLQRCTPETADPTGPSTHHEDEKATRADV